MSPFEWGFLAITILLCWGPALAFLITDTRRVLARRRQAADDRRAGETYSAVRTHVTVASPIRVCPGCGAAIPPYAGRGRPRKWCSDECRMSHKSANGARA